MGGVWEGVREQEVEVGAGHNVGVVGLGKCAGS